MSPGESVLNFDQGNHLWFVLSDVTSEGLVAVANLTTHGRSLTCGPGCTVVMPEEHPWLSHDSCLYVRGAIMNPVAPLDRAKAEGTLQQSAPCSPGLLRRLQEGAVSARLTPRPVRAAILATIQR